jgi:isopentenyl-diphosphate delta-isomerase
MDVILVDDQDRPMGTMEKMEVHQKALLHRAFSVFIFNENGQMLIQQRAAKKYHSPNLWTNACCSHPKPGEETIKAAQIRLQEEMGFSTTLTPAFTFTYKAPFDNGLTEHEFDHVLVGNYSGTIAPNPDEVSDYCFMNMEEIAAAIKSHSDKYTVWFKIAFPKVEAHIANIFSS